MKDVTKQSSAKTFEEIADYNNLLASFKDLNREIVNNFQDGDKFYVFAEGNSKVNDLINNLKEKTENPYKESVFWLQEEEMETVAMIELIGNIKQLIGKYDDIKSKIESLSSDVSNLQQGKKTIKSVFTMKKKEEFLKEEEEALSKLETESQALENILKIVTVLFDLRLKAFKKERTLTYYDALKSFDHKQTINMDLIYELWNGVLESVNQIKTQA